MLIDIVRMTSLHAGSRGVGNTKFIPSFPRMARVLGAPRGRRVGLTVNLLATTTHISNTLALDYSGLLRFQF